MPLFHEKVFASSLEAAFNCVSHLYGSENIIGVYDAPIKLKSGDSIPLSALAISICEQIKAVSNLQETLAVSIRVPTLKDSDEEPKTQEIASDSEVDDLIMDSWTVGSTVNPRKA